MTGARGWAGDVGVGIAAAVTFLVAWIAGGSLWEYVNSGDLHGMFLPWYEYVARALWHEGRVPLWQPWQFCGTPVLGLGQTGSLYPPILLLFGVLSSWAALQALYGLHVAILGTGMAAVLRVNGIGRLPAFVGTLIAVTALFRGPLLAGVDHPSFLCAMAWSPWVLFCWQRAATSATTGATRRWTAGVAAASALQWVAGYPDFPLDFAVLLGVVALVMDAGPLRRRVAVAIGGLALGAALAAVQLVPVTEVVAQSIRTEELQLKETMRALFSVFSLWQLGWAARNVWGIAAIALAVAAVVRPDRRRIAWATAFVWSVFALNRPFAWLYVLPPWDGVRFPFGWGGGVAVFLGLLAAAGIATTAAARASWVRAAGILLAVVAAGESIVVVRNSPSALPAFSPRNEGYRVPDVPDAAGRARLLAEAAGDGRALSERDGRAGNALRYRVRLVQGHEPSVLPRRIVHLLTAGGLYDNLGIFRDRDWRPLAERPGLAALLGVGAVGIAPRRSAALEGAGFARIGTLPGDDLLLYRAAPSRARLVHRSEVVPGGEAGSLAAVLAHPEGRLDVVVLEEGGTHPPLAEPPADASESARLVVDEPERVVVEATAAAPALLVFGDTAYPGWQADVDGTVAPILIADHAFRAVFVPPGRHTVTFVYAPRAVRVGLGVTLAASVVLLALLVIPARRRV